jgi:hypothetical protein
VFLICTPPKRSEYLPHPNREQMGKIAYALGCDISALIDHDPVSNFETFQIIFDYEELLKLRPLKEKVLKLLYIKI